MTFCCEDMAYHTYQPTDSEEKTILYIPRFNEYGIPCRDDSGASVILITHCPWCGKALPKSLRDEWFDKLSVLGFENPLFDDSIPQAFQTDVWWKGKFL